MITPCFDFELSHTISGCGVAIGRFYGEQYAIAYTTSGGKIVIFQPSFNEGGLNSKKESEQVLNFNKQIYNILSIPLDEEKNKDVLAICFGTSVQVYDVDKNKDIFYLEISDGASVMVYGILPPNLERLLFVGGNCSIRGFNIKGEEKYWNITGDNVCAMEFADIDADERDELIVGSEDNSIRGFKNEEIMFTLVESAKVSFFSRINPTNYAYSLDNGMVGIISKKQRQWRVRHRHKITALLSLNVPEIGYGFVVIGLDNGKLEFRREDNGSVVAKKTLNSPIVKLLFGDIKNTNSPQLICFTSDGHLRGFNINYELSEQENTENLTDKISQLQKQKQQIMTEMSALENKGETKTIADMVSSDIKILNKISQDQKNCQIVITLQLNKPLTIKTVLVSFDRAVGNSQTEIIQVHPSEYTDSATIYIPLGKPIEINLACRVLVGNSGTSQQYYGIDKLLKIPKFAMMVTLNSAILPSSRVTLCIKERVQRIKMWMLQCFLVENQEIEIEPNDNLYTWYFKSIKDNEILAIQMTGDSTGLFIIHCNSMELASYVVSDLADFLKVQELEGEANFPKDIEKLKSLLQKVEEWKTLKTQLNASIAESISKVKINIIKAEDCRERKNMIEMKKVYANLQRENAYLIGETKKGKTNYDQIISALKEINMIIEWASQLRYGNARNKVITLCRLAIKNSNTMMLAQIIRSGKDK